MASDEGNGGGLGGQYFIVREADCDEEEGSGDDSVDEGETEDDTDDGFLDDDECDQGESLALLQEHLREDSDRFETNIKRKLFGSPQATDTVDEAQCLSPRLQDISITPRKKQCRKQLFGRQDEANAPHGEISAEQVQGPGGRTVVVQAQVHRVSTPAPTPDPEPPAELNSSADSGVAEGTPAEDLYPSPDPAAAIACCRETFDKDRYVTDLLKSAHVQAAVLGQLRAAYEVAFSDITRPFKSNKSMSPQWVVGCAGTEYRLTLAARQLLQEHCDFILMKESMAGKTPCLLMLLRFKHEKNRDTVKKVVRHTLCLHDEQIVTNPPRTSVAAALYWFTAAAGRNDNIFRQGQFPDWVTEQTMVNHTNSIKNPVFELTKMVQWAYDHDYTDECEIALEYAALARKEVNAKAFIMSNAQPKYVKDCATMVRLYKRAEMKKMTMSEWVHERCQRVPEAGREDERGWRAIVQFLRRQGIEFAVFAGAMTQWLKGIPKRNCLVIQGAPDTGKSLFAMSLMKFMGGAVVSYVNSKSQFWLQPLSHAKVGLIDDATKPFWDYCDTYMRTAFDGNPVSIDVKHRAPVQMKFPPLLITTNVHVKDDARWHYLHSRIRVFTFPTGVHIRDGSTIEDKHWRSFFLKFWQTLELSDQEEEEEEDEKEEEQNKSSQEVDRVDGKDGEQPKPSTTIRFNRRRNT